MCFDPAGKTDIRAERRHFRSGPDIMFSTRAPGRVRRGPGTGAVDRRHAIA